MDTEWLGGVRLFSSEIPLAQAPGDAEAVFPLATYQEGMKSVDRGLWTSKSHGVATQVVWLSRPGSLIVSTFDGAILQLTQNLLDDPSASSSNSDAKVAPSGKGTAKESAKKPTFSKVIYRHADSVKHMKTLDQPSSMPYLVTATVAGDVNVIDAAVGKVSAISSQKLSSRPCSALTTSGSIIAISFEDQFVHMLDSNLATTSTLKIAQSEDPFVSSIALDHSGLFCAVATLDEHLYLYDLRKTDSPLASSSSSLTSGAIRSLNYSKDDKFLAAGSDDGHVRAWSSQSDLSTPIYDFKHVDRVTNVNWSSDAPHELISAAFDGLILRHEIKV
jgi:WD40 repeat protein